MARASTDSSFKWKVLSRKQVSDNRYAPLWRETCLLPSGKKVEYFTAKGAPDSVVVMPFTPEGKLILVRLYRHGAGRVFIEPPAGIIERGETPAKAGKRELLEETGYAPKRMAFLAQGFYDPSKSAGKSFVYAAFGCSKVAGQNLDETEQIQVRLACPRDFLERVLADKFANMRVAAALLAAKTRYPRLFS